MSDQATMLGIDRCVSSRLWYTSLSVLQTEYSTSGSSRELSRDCGVDLTELETIIQSLIHLPNEERYRWIAYMLLYKLVVDNESTDVDCNIKRNIQIELDLIQIRSAIELCDNASDYIYKELVFLQEANIEYSIGDTNAISQQTFTFLKENMRIYPEIVYWVINKLIPIAPNLSYDVANALRDIYFSTLKLCLEHIPVRENWHSSQKAFESDSLVSKSISRSNYLQIALCLLSKMNININTEIEFLKTIYSALSRVRDIRDIELALYTRRDGKLFTEWLLLWNEANACYENAATLNAAYKIGENMFKLTKSSKVVLCKQNLLTTISARKMHWLNDILDICYILTMNGKYNEVELLLSCNLLGKLYPILLLRALNDCPREEIESLENCDNGISICESIKFLLKKCYLDLQSDYDLNELHLHLKNHIKIVQYILYWKQKYFIKMGLDSQELRKMQSDVIEQAVSVTRIMSLLQKHNVLSVLRLTTNIHDLDHDVVENLLKEPGERTSFQAYRSIVSALKAILLCESYSVENKQVAKYFTDMVSYLSSLFPLPLRIETMENIFSLLFLRYEDFNVASATSRNDDCDVSFEGTGISESVEYKRTGFVSNKYAIRNTLHYLWESTLEATREIDRLQAFGDHAAMLQLHENISILTSALTNARWRLKFYMEPHYTENIGIPQDECLHSPFATNKSKLTISRKLNFPHCVEDDTFFYRKDSTSDETKGKSDSSSESGLLDSSNHRRKKRPRNIAMTADSSMTKDRPCLINLMLASKESLMLHCLWRSDLQKAQEVVEMFHVKNTQLDSEVRFAEAFRAFKQDTFRHAYTSDLMDDSSKGNAKTSTLENIRLVVLEGMQSSRYINQLETFLASQESHLRMLNMDALSSNEMRTLSVLDLSLTTGQTRQLSNSLCDVAVKYLKLCDTLDKTEHASFFSKICQLFYESKSDTPVTTVLCDIRIPLSVKEWKESNAFWSDFVKYCHAFNDIERTENTNDERRFRDNDCDFSGLKTLKTMSTIYNSDQTYLQNVYSHLQLVHTIIPDANIDINMQTVTDLLKMPLYRYFGYQIFDLQTEPDKLEIIASSLRVNLIYSILVNACPNISCYNEKSYTNIEDIGCVILNRNESTVKSVTIKKPNQCISKILTELVRAIRNVSSGQSRLDSSHLRSIANYTDIQNALSETSCLATLDLGELSLGDETLTFFLNVWNVMFLHASLTVWCDDPPLNNLRYTVFLTSVGYVIGDLGLVTLAALRLKLLGSLANDYKRFTRIEELNELAWQDLDLVQNPKVFFAMANEFYETPEIRVYETQTLNESLNDALQDYVSHYSKLLDDNLGDGSTRRKISLPDLMREYRNALSQSSNVGMTVPSINSSHSPRNGNLSVVDGPEILNEDVDIEYIAPTYAHHVILTYSEYNVPNVKATNAVKTLLWQTRRLRSNLLQYLESHCWLFSYLLQRMHNENPTILDNNCDNIKRTACLENLLNSSWVNKLKSLFNDNQTLAAIHDDIPARDLWSYFEFQREDYNWEDCLEILNALPDNAMNLDVELLCFKDLILSHVLSNQSVPLTPKMLRYLYQIKDIRVLARTILHNVNKWPMSMCEHALLHALQHKYSYKLPAHCKHRMNGILCRITIFHKMMPYCVSKSNSTWYDVMYCTAKINPFEIIKSLIDADQFELCLEWLECQEFSLEIQPTVIQDFLMGLLKNQQRNFDQALKFLRALPSSQSVKACKGVFKKLESTSALQFIANYLLENCKTQEKPKYRRTLVGVDILKMLDNKDRTLYIHLVKEPLLMLEQLLMNCKFESIQKILNALHEDLHHPDVSVDNFDKVIRFYAKKSLDFRVSLQRDGIENRSKPSLSQTSLEAESNEFVMPVNVPTRDDWIPNDKARECSCCKAVIFSMFNRRHHCRRCGRVVCAVCSQHRMQVAGYPTSVSVRVCDDCKRQTILQMRAVQGTPSTLSSEAFDHWRLTKDERHNHTIREEFSFEHAPNISLCLAILNLHSDHKMYTSFLLDRCDEMKQLLQPVSDGRINPEVDHAVIIKMIRSLLIAAKVKCAKLGFNTGLAHCDRFLSQVDLIMTLVQSDCLTLIPTDDLDEHALRKLRDLLTEKEQWTLALDVSTKAGLDTQGVWAAWGKACLKVGYFDQARDKFYHCLDKIVHEDLDDWVVLTYSKESIAGSEREVIETLSLQKRKKVLDESEKMCETGHSRRNEFFKCRPAKDPPLLTEILQILDNLSVHRSRMQHAASQARSNTAREILQTLNDLKAIGQNQFNVKHLIPTNQTVYYQESLYYLLTYASYSSILQFFLKHKEFEKCLTYVLENDLERDLFLNGIYLCCLKNGDIEKLHDAMKTRDSTLITWRKYLMHVCHFMEKKQYWYTLYQIQLFMKDYVRASMTCIRLYSNEANTYSDLHSRSHLLQDAQRHLESELQIESLNKRGGKASCSIHSNQDVLIMEMEPSDIDRHINTICRQTEIAKFLTNCEKEGRAATEFLSLFPDVDGDNSKTSQLPTLFDNQQQKIHLAVLAILCGRDIEEGFGIAFRIIQDYNLPQQKVYSLAGHILALRNNAAAIEQLIKCCRSSGAPNANVISDYVLTHCVKLLLNRSYDSEQNLKNYIDTLVRLIMDTELRINAYIESKQLKAAYLLAVKHSRAQDIRRILKESDRLGQNAIKAICLKWLQQEPKG